MNLHLTSELKSVENSHVEILERKGSGHPDTLSDMLAEELSITYSLYCLKHFGAILRHQFDKLVLMCGHSEVGFGWGRLISPIRVLINGRASLRLGNHKIPVKDILTSTTRNFFANRFPMLNAHKDLRLLFEMNQSTTGGILGDSDANSAAIHYRFNPRTLADLPESHRLESNDTSMGCAFAPFSPFESLIIDIEKWLNSSKLDFPWLGSDIKIMGKRVDQRIAITIAAPLLSEQISNYEEYESKIFVLKTAIQEFVDSRFNGAELDLLLNAGDDIERRKLYMNWTGSSIESGDEGQVGRGNRLGGVIAPMRPYTMEGICGKNPVYHTGKVYSAVAWEIAWKLYSSYGVPVEVYLISQMGRPLDDPWQIYIRSRDLVFSQSQAMTVATEFLSDIPSITNNLLERRYPLA